jgi:hypothetical protein
MNFRDAPEFDPETYGGQGGLLGRLQAMLQQSRVQPGADSASPSNGGPEYNPDSYSPQGGLLGRLLALQAEQNRYQPIPGANGAAPSVSQNLDSRQLSLASIVPPGLANGALPNGGHSQDDSEIYRDRLMKVLYQGSGAGDGQQICRLMLPAAALKMCLYLCPNGEIRRLPIDSHNLGCPPFILQSHGFGPEQ